MSRASDFTPYLPPSQRVVHVGPKATDLSGSLRVTAADRRRAQLVLAAYALDAEDPAEWLADVLGYLGLFERVTP